jgi:hypothetical protein
MRDFKWLEKFREIEHISAFGYNITNGDTKILFLGSCRMIMLCLYIIEYLKFTPASFGISIITDYHYKLLKKFESPMDPKIKEIVENADIIIHEPTKQMDYLNTAINTDINIYNRFNLKPAYRNIRIPHIGSMLIVREFRIFCNPQIVRQELNYDDPSDLSPLSITEINMLREQNINKLLKYVDNYEFPKLATLIRNNWKKQRLFATFSHPMPICFIYLLKDLIPKLFGVQLDGNIENHLNQIDSMILLGIQSFLEEDYESGMSREIHNNY